MVYFTADFHLAHHNIMEYCNRPFGKVSEMDDCLLTMLYETLHKGDILYYLGDLTFKKPMAEKFFDICDDRKAQVYYIIGNHDKSILKIAQRRSIWCHSQKYISINGKGTMLNHFCMRVWHKSHFNSYHAYAHSHGGLEPIGKMWDVGVDNNDFQLVSFERFERIMDKSPNNFNYLSMEEKE